jgi:hypothetical protein
MTIWNEKLIENGDFGDATDRVEAMQYLIFVFFLLEVFLVTREEYIKL